MTHHKELRTYLQALEAIGEVQPIRVPVALDLEIGAISRRAGETGQAAPLFESIPERPGFRVLGAPGGVSSKPSQWLARIALAVGLPASASGRDIVETFASARSRPLVPPNVLASGPCKENIHVGPAVDLMKLPAPLLHDGDGGRYLNTFGVICCETPDKRWRSWSIARIMVVDGKRMAGIIAPNQHVGMVRQTWTDLGKDMPFALALGAQPVIPYVGGMPLPDHVSEVEFAGAITGEPIDCVRAETVDVLVPATSEIVVEGFVSRTDTAPEGPMGEYAGYLWEGPPSPKPVYHVTAITHRDDAILPISVAGEPPEENHTAWGIPNAGEIVFLLRDAGFPVATAWSTFESANHWFVIAVERDWRSRTGLRSSELCRRVADVLFAKKGGMGTPKYIVVNDDIDITNTREVVWAFATRNHPGSRGTLIYDDENTNPLVAYIDDAEKGALRTTKVIYDCLDPEHLHGRLPKRSSFRFTYPPAIQQRVRSRWSEYGYADSEGSTNGSTESSATSRIEGFASEAEIETNMAAARRFVQGVLGGADAGAFDAVVHPEVVVDTGLKPDGRIVGAAEYGRVLAQTMGAAFSNGALSIKDIAALVDGRVVVRFEATADNTGDLNGIAATGRRFTFCELHLMRFEDGRLIENWVGALNPLQFEMWQAPATLNRLATGET